MSLQDEFNALGQSKIDIRNAIQSKGVTLASPNDMTTYAEAISGIVVGTRNIGEIVQSTIPLVDAGLHLLDGGIIVGGGIYDAFVDYIASIYDSSANYFCTEAEWQQAVIDYGVCGKFVYDSTNNTVRLPKYNSKIYTGGGTAPVVGNGTTLGWTDGTHNGGSVLTSAGYGLYASGGYNIAVGATTNENALTMNTNKAVGITTDPTKSGILAQLSDITTSLDGYYYIVIANTTKTDIEVDIDEIATDLASKANVNLDNVAASKGILTESYMSGTSWYNVYSNGWCEQGGYTTSTSVTLLKPYTNTNFHVMVADGTNVGSTSCTNVTITNNSTLSFNISWCAGAWWEAKGYIS